MIAPPLPFSPPREKTTRVHTSTQPGLIPFVVQRKGEEAAPDNLVILSSAPGRHRLYYRDEDRRDRDLRGVLWARCSFNPVDGRKMPMGEPQWKLMHPYRQMVTMQAMRCQVCTDRARTRLGFIFLTGPGSMDPGNEPVLTNQPPVCPRHVRAAIKLCPHLGPMVFLAQSAPLYGVRGTLYGVGEHGVEVVAQPDGPLPYGHPNLPTFLASQQVRRLGSFRVVHVEQLMRDLKQTA